LGQCATDARKNDSVGDFSDNPFACVIHDILPDPIKLNEPSPSTR
jgi:hypothetical protein